MVDYTVEAYLMSMSIVECAVQTAARGRTRQPMMMVAHARDVATRVLQHVHGALRGRAMRASGLRHLRVTHVLTR